VNLKEHAKTGFSYLRPLQVAYESPKFMLPIRLGMVNADGPQELFVYTLTRRGRVEATNYRTVKLPTGMDLPVFVKDRFPDFYRAMFTEQVKRENFSAIFLEYAWDTGWCDPCAAAPPTDDELRQLGVFWRDDSTRGGAPFRQPSNVFITRLHVRYDAAHFPEDLVFQETGDRTNFQGRYVLRHAWTGADSCGASGDYTRELSARREREAQTLASLTAWDVGGIRKDMGLSSQPPAPEKWWEKIWRR
jgi:hypothetical protein